MNEKSERKKLSIKDLKQRGRKVLKAHYLLLLLTCLFSAFVGSEFADSFVLADIETSELSELISLPSEIVEGTQEFFGTGRGVLWSIITSFSTGTIYDSMISGVNTILGTETAGLIIVVVFCLVLAFIFWFFVGNMYSVISRRIFLESRIYQKVTPNKFIFLHRVKKWLNVSKVMLLRFVLNALWYCVFIVGGIVKRYSYFLVPHILAENPSISSKDAIQLSKDMMFGHKKECFLLELSYIGWMLLRVCTLGLSGLFYSNAYQIATYTEYYTEIRTLAKERGVQNIELLNDTYLYEKADKALIEENYSDVIAVLKASKNQKIAPKSKAESILNNFGITLHRKKGDEKKELVAVKIETAKEFEEILSAEQYPNRLFALYDHTRGSEHEVSNYMVKYTIPTLIMFFFVFSFVGWVWEGSLYLVRDGVFVNRGTMHGPWLPIYGSGGVLILTLLYKLRKHALTQFFAAVVLCGVVEYFTSYVLEIMSGGVKWWDYSGYFMNLHGRICAEGLIVFGLGGIAVVYALAPSLSHGINKFSHRFLVTLSCGLLAVFIIDALYSSQNPNTGYGVTMEKNREGMNVSDIYKPISNLEIIK